MTAAVHCLSGRIRPVLIDRSRGARPCGLAGVCPGRPACRAVCRIGCGPVDVVGQRHRSGTPGRDRSDRVDLRRARASSAWTWVRWSRAVPRRCALVAGDSNVGSLTGDDVVVSTMDVSTQSTGANLLWQGADGTNFGGLVGSGVGVVVIDSGIGLHPDVDRRVKLRRRLRQRQPRESAIVFGHGTHVASLIAGQRRGQPRQRRRGLHRHGAWR